MPHRRIVLAAALLALLIGPQGAWGNASGIGGVSGNPSTSGGATCAACHTGPSGAVLQIFDQTTGSTNPSSIESGAARQFRARVTGGPAQKCGFNLSATGGTLAPFAADTKHPPAPNAAELTHNGAKTFGGGVCEFLFLWTAPVVGSPTAVTFFGAGASVEGGGGSVLDATATDTHSITVLPPAPPVLSCTPESLSPSVAQGQNAASQGFSCSNTGGQSLSYAVSDDVAWLSVSPTSGSGLGAGANQNHTVTYTTSGLGPGDHSATISVNGGAAGSDSVAVTLTVNAPPPVLSCTPESLSPSVTQGQNAASQGFSCSNSGGQSLSYAVSDDVAWLSVSPTSGSGLGAGANQNHTVTYTTSGLGPGDHTATISVNGGAAGSDSVAVTLTVNAPPPVLSCTPESLSPSVTQGQNAASQGFSCSNSGGQSLSYSVSDDVAWLSVSPTSGSGLGAGANQNHTVTYTTSGLGPGDHSATISVNGGAAGSDSVAVTLTVNAPPPVLSCTPESLSPSVAQGQNAASQGFSCSNSGGQSLSYAVSDDVAWLSVSPTSGSGLGAGANQNHTVTYTTSGLGPGNHSATISVNGGAAGSDSVAVTLSVNAPPPVLSCTPESLSPSVAQGQDAASQGFSCSNTGGQSLSYTVTDDVAWLSVSPTSGSGLGAGALQNHTVTYTTSGLGPGNHSSTISVDGGAAGSDSVAVTLSVNDPPAVLACTPESLAPTTPPGEDAASQFFSCSNSGGQSLSYSVTDDVAWLSVSPTSGDELGAGANQNHTVTYTTSGLAPGEHTATISVDGGEAGSDSVAVTLSVNTATPANDDWTDASAVPAAGATFLGTLVGGSPDGDDSLGVSFGSADVWYRYTAATAGLLSVDTCGTNDRGGIDSGMDSVLSLHSAGPGTVENQLDANDDWGIESGRGACEGIDLQAQRDSVVFTFLEAGQVVLIRVAHWNGSGPGSFVLHVRPEFVIHGNAVGWGENGIGQATPPDAVNGIAGTASAIAAGAQHACAIETASGGVVCWGDDFRGQATPPDRVNGSDGTASAIAAGREHSCAIEAGSGEAVCWGSNDFFQSTPPDSVNGADGTASAIAARELHSCAIQTDTGNAVCWGWNAHGQATPPDSVNGIDGSALAIAAGWYHSCAIEADTDRVVCWGNDASGQSTPPNSVNGINGTASAIAAGGFHGCAIQTNSGEVVCWGGNSVGQATPPDSVNGNDGTASAIAAGYGHSCAIQAGTGNAVCWGYDSAGQSTPPNLVNGTDGTASAIAAGNYFSLAITPIPEPGGWLASLTALGALAVLRRFGIRRTR